MRADQRTLQLGAVLGRDMAGSQGAETGGNAIDRGVGRGEGIDVGANRGQFFEDLWRDADLRVVPGYRNHVIGGCSSKVQGDEWEAVMMFNPFSALQ